MPAIRRTSKAVGMVAIAVATVTVTLMSDVAVAWKYGNANATEYVQLPKFCWGDFSDGALVGPEYFTPPDCGVGMNHYCWGLLDLQRSKKAKNLSERQTLLGTAKVHTLYTIGWMKREGTTATCPIAAHVDGTLRDIQLQMKIYGLK